MNHLDENLRKLRTQEPARIPDVVKKRIEDTLLSLPERKKRASLSQKVAIGGAAASLLLGTTIVAAAASPNMAQTLRKLPLVGSVFDLSGDTGIRSARDKGLTHQVEGKEVRIHGDLFKVTEVLYDENRLSIGFIYQTNGKLNQDEMPDFDFWMNGKPIGAGFALTGDIINSQTFSGILHLKTNKKLPDTFDLQLQLIDRSNPQKRWQLTFPIKKADSNEKIYTFNVKKKSKDVDIAVKKLVLTESGTELFIEGTFHNHDDPFRLFDDPFRLFSTSFLLSDDRGIVLQLLDQSGSSQKIGQQKFRLLYAPLKRAPKFMVIQMLDDKWKKAHKISFNQIAFQHEPSPQKPILLSQGEAGTIRINRLEFLPDKTVVHYQIADTPNPFEHFHELELKDHKGKKYRPIQFPQVENPDTYSFIAEFKPIKKEELHAFVTRKLPRIQIREDLTIKIPIPPK